MNTKKLLYILGFALGILFLVWLVWFIFFRSTPANNTNPATFFGSSSTTFVQNNTGAGGSTGGGGDTNQQQGTPQGNDKKVFKIADGPVASATFVQTLGPTTTLARYIMQNNSHVYDYPLGISGVIARAVSNVTVPGILQAVWVRGGGGAAVQYYDSSVVKTAVLSVPPPSGVSATTTAGTHIQFLPNGIVSFDISPDGKSVAYLLRTTGGTVGYTANINGSGIRKLFSTPLTQILLSWPSQNTLLVQTKSALSAPGMAFSVDAKSGAMAPLVYSVDLSVIANNTFSKVVYQSNQTNNDIAVTYARDMESGRNVSVPLSTVFEKCAWGPVNTQLYCAGPLSYTLPAYPDLWRQGRIHTPDLIYKTDLPSSATRMVAQPGSKDGGSPSDIAQIAVSPDEHYLLYITRGDRSLWGVRLAQ